MTCINAEIKSSDCFSDIQYLFFYMLIELSYIMWCY